MITSFLDLIFFSICWLVHLLPWNPSRWHHSPGCYSRWTAQPYQSCDDTTLVCLVVVDIPLVILLGESEPSVPGDLILRFMHEWGVICRRLCRVRTYLVNSPSTPGECNVVFVGPHLLGWLKLHQRAHLHHHKQGHQCSMISIAARSVVLDISPPSLFVKAWPVMTAL